MPHALLAPIAMRFKAHELGDFPMTLGDGGGGWGIHAASQFSWSIGLPVCRSLCHVPSYVGLREVHKRAYAVLNSSCLMILAWCRLACMRRCRNPGSRSRRGRTDPSRSAVSRRTQVSTCKTLHQPHPVFIPSAFRYGDWPCSLCSRATS